MTTSPTIAVVILNWNGKTFLEKFLPSVTANSKDLARIIIADNGSTDHSIQFVTDQYPDLEIIRFDQNMGFAKGYNEALKLVTADYYVLLNSDVEVPAGWLEPMLSLLERDKTIAACQPKILSYANKSLFDYAGAAGGWLDKYGYPFAKGRLFDICETDRGQFDQEEPIFWASGAALFIRASVFHEVKGFDEYFFAHQEEIDLCWRIQLAGYQVYSCPSSKIYHVGGGTLPRGNSRKTYLNFRNNKIMMSKNLPFPEKIWTMSVRNLLDAVSALKGLMGGDAGYCIAIIRAHFAFMKWWLFYQSRSVFPSKRRVKLQGLLHRNTVWLHFVKKKKLFSEIVDQTV